MADKRTESPDFILEAPGEDDGSVRSLAEQLARRDEVQQRAFDALYTELRQYKEDFIFQAEKPLLLDLLLFYDSLNWFQQSLLRQEMSGEVVADSFQYLVDEFLELLYRRDVTPMEGREHYDRETQKVIKVVYTDQAARDYTVQQVLKRGFRRADRVLRPEDIVLRRHDPVKAAEQGEPDEG